MITIKQIFDEIASEPGTNKKMEILGKYNDNQLLKDVLYLANSGRVKFYIKQIPEYNSNGGHSLQMALIGLEALSSRKVTGNEAIGYLKSLLTSLSADDAYVIERIIDRDCKIGMGTSNINKVFPKLIEDTYYMGAVPFDEKKIRNIFEGGKQGISEVKADGRYCNVTIADGNVDLVSRQGEETLITGALLLDEFAKFDDCVLNGELIIDSVEKKITLKKDETIEIDGVKYKPNEIVNKFY